MKTLDIYLSSEKLYGDDFALEEIEQRYADEKERYANPEAEYKLGSYLST